MQDWLSPFDDNGKTLPFCAAICTTLERILAAFLFCFGFATLIVFGIGFAMSSRSQALEGRLEDIFNALPDFTPTMTYSSGMHKNVIAIDAERQKIAVILNPMKLRQLKVDPVVYRFADVVAVELVRDDSVLAKTNRGSQIAGAAIGGALAGGAGLIVGGLSGSTSQRRKIEKLSLKIYTNSLMYPFQEVFWWDSPGVGIDPANIQHISLDIENWYGRFRAIVAK